MSLEQKDIEVIEKILYGLSDDLSSDIQRNFERVHARIDDTESRVYLRISDLDDKVCGYQEGIVDAIETLREEVIKY